MLIEVLKSKIHRVTVTNADLNYIGSITLDKNLIEAANLIVGEKVQIHFKVRIKDDHIQSWINGVMIGDVYDDLTDNGYIALQLQGIGRKALKANKKIRWKNLVLTEL